MSLVARSVRDPGHRPDVPRLKGRKLYEEPVRLEQRARLLHKLDVLPDFKAGAEAWRQAVKLRGSGVGVSRKLPGPVQFAWLCGLWRTCKTLKAQQIHTTELALREHASLWGCSKSTVADVQWWAEQLELVGVERRKGTVELVDESTGARTRKNWFRTSRRWATDKLLALLRIDEASRERRRRRKEQAAQEREARRELAARKNREQWAKDGQERRRQSDWESEVALALERAPTAKAKAEVITAALATRLEGRRVG